MTDHLHPEAAAALAQAKADAGTKQLSIFAKFAAMGYSPIPIYKIDGRYKWPPKWSDFCARQADEAEVAKWARRYDGVALCGGCKISWLSTSTLTIRA